MPDFESLYNESQANAFTSAKKRFYDNKVDNLNEENYDGKTVIQAVVHGHRDYHTSIVFDEQGGLYDYSCDCYGFSMQSGPCKHILATALTYEEKNPSSGASASVKKRSSDGCIAGLISVYAKKRQGKILKDDTPVSLIPVIELLSDDSVALRFSVAKTRAYKLKNLAQFASDCVSAQYRRYGAQLAFDHIMDNFSEKSSQLVSFLIKTVAERQANGGEFKGDRIRLFPSDLDDFISIADGLIEVEEGRVSEGMRYIVKEPDALKVSIFVNKESEGYRISSDVKEFKLLYGKRYYYLMTSGQIYRVTDQFVETSYPLIKQLNAHESVFVSERDMTAFYNNVLMQTTKLAVVSDTDLSSYLLPPLVASLYLDINSSMVIDARLECSYNGEKVDIDDEPSGSEMRDYEAEKALRACLSEFFPFYPHLTLDAESDIFKLLSEGLRRIGRFCSIYMSTEMQRIKVRKPPSVKVGVKLSGDLIELDVSDDDYTYEELLKIIDKAGKSKYVRIGDAFVDLDYPSLRALGKIMDLNSSLTLPSYYAPRICEELKEHYDVTEIESKIDADDGVDAPDSLGDIMRPYQKAGLRWMSALLKRGYGGILADDMGLGKSLQVISLIVALKLKSIIVCPTTLVLNWENEFKKFAPFLRTLCVIGSMEDREKLLTDAKNYDVVITSYELIRRDIHRYDMGFDLAVIDEAQFIKNPDTKNARTVKEIKCKYRFALTGTPIENSLSELWSIFDFIMPGYLFSYRKFKEKFELPIAEGSKVAEDELLKLVMPFILRRLKTEVLSELPPKVETDVVVPLEGQQEELYKAHVALIRKSIMIENADRITVLSMLTRLRRICCDPHLIDPSYEGNSAKLEACMQIVRQAIDGKHKVLIFSQFTSMLDIIRNSLMENGITNYLLRGDTSKSERMKFVNRFNKDDTQVFLISLKAGGTGLNLIGADVVIHYDPWWNESVMNQATDRAYRIGQDKKVQVYSLIVNGTLEQKIVELQKKKARLSGLIENENPLSDVLKLLD